MMLFLRILFFFIPVAVLVAAIARSLFLDAQKGEETRARMMLLKPFLPDSFIDPLLAKYPKSRELLAVWCTSVTRDGFESPEAARRVTIFYQKFPRDETAVFFWGSLLSAQGRYEEAEKILGDAKDSIRAGKHRCAMYQAHARIAQLQGHDQEALRRWREVEKKFPGNIPSYVAQASILLRRSDHADARVILTEALTRHCDNESLLRLRAQLAMAQKDWTDAERWWGKYREHHDSRTLGYLSGAEASFRSGNSAMARHLLENVEMLFPRDEAAADGKRRLMAQYSDGQ